MTTLIEELAMHPELIYRHTVDDYHQMIANGTIIEGEPFELLDGQIVRKIRSASGEDIMTVGIEHALIVKKLAKMSRNFEPLGCHVQSQQPVAIPPADEPEPDAAVIRGKEEDYDQRHPGPADVLCIVEVADSSLSRDRGYKLRLYANAGIGMYLIVNLIDRLVEIYREPLPGSSRFARMENLSTGQTIRFPTATADMVEVPASQMFRQ